METNNDNSRSLSLRTDRLFARMIAWVRDNRYPFFSALIIGLFSYLFTFTNKLVIHDDLAHLFSKGFTLSSGRWGLELISYVLPDISMPWFHGIITLVLIAVAVCAALRLLEIRNPLLQSLAAGLIICFPSLTGTFGYMFTSSSYGAALLLAVLSAVFLDRADWKGTLGGCLCCLLSLSIYQAYISVTVTLLVLALLRRTLYTELPVKKIFFRGLWFVTGLILSLGLYWIATSLIQSAAGVAMNSYAAGALSQEDGLLSRVINCIKMPFYILLLGYKGLVHEGLMQVLHLVFLAVILLELLLWCLGCKEKSRIAMGIFLTALLPFSLNAILLFTSLSAVHALVLYGFAGIYILAALVLDGGLVHPACRKGLAAVRRLSMDTAIVCLAMILFSNASTANRASMNLHLRYENNYSMATSIITQIEALPGFTSETPVTVVGYFPYTNDYDALLDVDHLTGVSEHATRGWEVKDFLRYYCGADFNFIALEENTALLDSPDFQAMPFFPDQGSIAMVDGTVAVKLDPWMLPEEFVNRILAQ